MGTLRFLLALFVVLAHMDAWDPQARTAIGGGVVIAVNFFFLISGFYMALVLNRKYTDVLSFYKARALRLFPLYWLTMAVSLVVIAFTDSPLNVVTETWGGLWKAKDYGAMAFLLFANLSFLGLDFGQMAEINKVELTNYTLLPQAWTLGIEVMFYALIPLLIRRKGAIIGALLMSVGVKIWLMVNGAHNAPLDRQLFAAVLVYFMLGVVAYAIYDRAESFLVLHKRFCLGVAVALALSLLAYAPFADMIYKQHKVFQDAALHPLMFTGFTFAVPCLFALTKDWHIDRLIGELSYPLYITHLTALAISGAFVDAENGWIRTALHLSAVITVALIGCWLTDPMFRRVISLHGSPRIPASGQKDPCRSALSISARSQLPGS